MAHCSMHRLSALLVAALVLLVFAACAAAQTDEEIRSLIVKTGDAKTYPDAAVVSVFDRTDVTVEESGLAHYRRHTLTKILTEAGVLDRAALRFDYDPASNFIDVKGIRIFRTGGAVETVDLAAAKDLYAPASMIYWGGRA